MSPSHSPECIDNNCLNVLSSNLVFEDPMAGYDLPWFTCDSRHEAVAFRLSLKIHPDLVEDLEEARVCNNGLPDSHTVRVDVGESAVQFLRSDLDQACGCATEVFALDENLCPCVIMGMRCWEETLEEQRNAARKIYAPDPTHYKIHRGKSLRQLAEKIEGAEKSQGKKRVFGEVGGDSPEAKRMKALLLLEEPVESAALKSGRGLLVEDGGEWGIVSKSGHAFEEKRRVGRGRRTV
ncbi:hypothetical protein AAF712_002404 [Marasmius tenuissimus]|uniref:SWIM-type domain-containing protein n=1 Tax=Marasmius tenuissimus TaxID=585030 RepID=A0ABR3AAL3_9AGAR